jgi:signal peptidase II
MLLSIILIAGIVVLDRLSKYWAMTVLAPAGELAGIKGIFHFYYVENTGAAFSLLREHTWILIIITVLVVVGGIYVLFFKKLNMPYRICISAIVGGGIGNLIDRIAYGYVVDMFMVDFVEFAIFNVADIFITLGGIALIVVLLFFDKEHPLFTKKTETMEISDEFTEDQSDNN